MKKCVVRLIGDTPIATIYGTNGIKETTLRDLDLIRYLGRIDERLYGRKVRRNPFSKEEKDGNTLIYINKAQGKNIRIQNYRVLTPILFDLYRKNKEEIRTELAIENKKKVQRRCAAAGAIMIGGLALAQMGITAKQNLDLQTVATYDEEQIQVESTKYLDGYIQEVSTEEYNNDVLPHVGIYSEDTSNLEQDNSEITEEEIAAIVNTPLVQVDVQGVYDSGIEENIEKIEDIIHERGPRWGVGENLLHDIISQESAGGSLTNIGQFEFDIWKDHPITIHNFEDNKDVTVVFSNDEAKWNGKADMVITEENLKNKKTSISTAAIILRYYLDLYNQNIPLAIQAYNRGETNMNALIEKTCAAEGISREELINNPSNLSWIKYAWKDENGLTYFEEVIKHLNSDQLDYGINDIYEALIREALLG